MERGDVHELRAVRAARGHEQHGRRYAVVVQADELWPWSTVIAVPTTTAAAASVSFRPRIDLAGTKTTALIDQVAAFDVERFGNRVARISPADLAAIDTSLKLVLALY